MPSSRLGLWEILHGQDNSTLHTEDKPLVPLINSRPPHGGANARSCIWWGTEYVPGKTLTVADTLSRQLLPVIQSEVSELTCEVSAFEALNACRPYQHRGRSIQRQHCYLQGPGKRSKQTFVNMQNRTTGLSLTIFLTSWKQLTSPWWPRPPTHC